jgi:hypothetical protein
MPRIVLTAVEGGHAEVLHNGSGDEVGGDAQPSRDAPPDTLPDTDFHEVAVSFGSESSVQVRVCLSLQAVLCQHLDFC